MFTLLVAYQANLKSNLKRMTCPRIRRALAHIMVIVEVKIGRVFIDMTWRRLVGM